MNIANVIDAVANQLDTISGLRVFAYDTESIYPPTAIVEWPDAIAFDQTYVRGMDRITLPVKVLVSRTSLRAARIQLAPYCAGSGSSSVKAVLEAGTYTALDTLVVKGVTFGPDTIGTTEYEAAFFEVDIAGQGA